MAFINVAEWTPTHVADWLKGTLRFKAQLFRRHALRQALRSPCVVFVFMQDASQRLVRRFDRRFRLALTSYFLHNYFMHFMRLASL